MFPYSWNTSGCLREREIEVGTWSCRASVSTLFRVLPNFHECFYNVWEHVKKVFYFVYKITRRKLKRGNSLLYQSVNSPYRSRWRMRWRIMAWTFPCFPYSYRNTAFSQSILTFSKCYFIKDYECIANRCRKWYEKRRQRTIIFRSLNSFMDWCSTILVRTSLQSLLVDTSRIALFE